MRAGPGRGVFRRQLLVGGAATTVAVAGSGALVETGIAPGKGRLNRLLGLDGDDGTIPDVAPGPRVVDGSIASKYRLDLRSKSRVGSESRNPPLPRTGVDGSVWWP